MDVGSAWGEEKPAPWMDQTLTTSSWPTGPKHKPSWDGDLDPSSWVHPTKQVCILFYFLRSLLEFLYVLMWKVEYS